MNLKLVDLLGSLFTSAAPAQPSSNAPVSDAFAALLQQMRSPQAAPTQLDGSIAVDAPVDVAEAESTPVTGGNEEASETTDGEEPVVDDESKVSTDKPGPPPHRNIPAVTLPEPAILHALHSNGAPFEAYRAIPESAGMTPESNDESPPALAPAKPLPTQARGDPLARTAAAVVTTVSTGDAKLPVQTAAVDPARPAPPAAVAAVAVKASAFVVEASDETSPHAFRGNAPPVRSAPSVGGHVKTTGESTAAGVPKHIGNRSTPLVVTRSADSGVAAQLQAVATPERPLRVVFEQPVAAEPTDRPKPAVRIPSAEPVAAALLAKTASDETVTATAPSAVAERVKAGMESTRTVPEISVPSASAERARTGPETVRPVLPEAVPDGDGFRPTEGAQHRAARAVEVLSTLRNGGIPSADPESSRAETVPRNPVKATPTETGPKVSVRPEATPEDPVRARPASAPTSEGSRAVNQPREAAGVVREPVDRSASSIQGRAEPPAPVPTTPGVELGRSGIPVERLAMPTTVDRPALLSEPIAQTVVQHVRHIAGSGDQTVVVKLVPASLGEVQITVKSTNDTVEVVLTSSNQQVRQTLEHQLHALRDTLVREGIDVTKATVTTPVTGGNDVHTSFAKAGDGHQPGAERHGSNQSSTGSHSREPDVPNRNRRSWNPHDGRLNVFA